ncbi:DUF2269 family protein [Leifsonia poae]|uniref:Conjugal transfer protein TrbL n=1 Tax=Leifsonia poae TaxID=110933 RepID=A0A9W6HA45_9MICO|nr:DUF2269 family protein [Leifsonia poae]GLJ76731.1 hypothetical protein GCM10017584_23050 [Leifsonia poae]
MDTLFNVLHVVSAVFIVGPMAILPMTAMRAVRAGNASQVRTLAKSTNIFSLLSLLTVLFGFAVMGMSDPKYKTSITTPWILWSIIAYVIALGLTLFVVVPAMRRAADALDGLTSATAAPAVAGGSVPTPAAEAADLEARGYPAIAAGSGVASILLVVVVVLMVWKP